MNLVNVKVTDLTVEGIEGKLHTRFPRRLTRRWRPQLFRRPDTQRVENDKTWRQREEGVAREPAFRLAGQGFFR